MKKIALTFGGDSCEHDISIITALSVYMSIYDIYEIYPIYIKNNKFYLCKNGIKIEDIRNFNKKKFIEIVFYKDGIRTLSGLKKFIPIYCVLNCNHGGAGENGSLVGMFETLGIPYTSASVYPSALFMDKVSTKFFLEKVKLPSVPYIVLKKGDKNDKIHSLELPLIVKPSSQGSSIGISIAHNEEELTECINYASNFDEKIIIEKALLDYKELNCAVVKSGDKIIVSDVEEIAFSGDFYDFSNKYENKESKRKIPAEIDKKIYERVQLITKKIYTLADLKGVIRIDFLLSEGKLYVNEINTVPGSLAFYLFKGQKISLEKLIAILIEEGVSALEKEKKLLKKYEGGVLENINIAKLDFCMKK